MNKKKTTSLILEVKKLNSGADVPETHYETDAGLDLASMHKMVIPGQTQKTISTGLAFKIPDGHFGKIFDRSGMASRTALMVKAGVIDSDYTGEIKVILANTSSYPETVMP